MLSATATVMPHTGSTAVRASSVSGDRPPTVWMTSARIDTATSPGVRAPIHSPAGVRIRARCPGSRSSPASTAAPRLGLATSPMYGTSARTADSNTGSSSRPCEAITNAWVPASESGVIPSTPVDVMS